MTNTINRSEAKSKAQRKYELARQHELYALAIEALEQAIKLHDEIKAKLDKLDKLEKRSD